MDNNNIKNNEYKSKLLFIRRINLNKNQKIQKDIDRFFWDAGIYFKKDYDEFDIILGKKQNKKEVIPSYFTTYGKRRNKKTSTIKVTANSSQSNDKKINDSKLTMNSNISRFGGGGRRGGLSKNNKDSGLKVGQKYITESELEDLFQAFCLVQKKNKKKSSNFIMAKEYIDNNILMSNKIFSNFGKMNESRKNQVFGFNKILPELSNTYDSKTITKFKNTSNLNSDYNKSIISTMTTNIFKDSKDENKNNIINHRNAKKFKMSAFMKDFLDKEMKLSEDKKYKTTSNFFDKEYLEELKKVKNRNKLVKRQNQFLLEKKEGLNSAKKATNDYFAKLLADQEQVMVNTKKMKSKKRKLLQFISTRIKKKEKNMLLKDIESYRVQNELKNKFCLLGDKLEPEHNYCWKKDLRGDLYIHKKNENNPNYFNIRNPYNKTLSISFSDKNLTKKKYVKYYKNLIEENNNINKNLEGLCIKGKNLLKMEYDQFKSLKSRKIINNYELYLPSSDVDDIIFVDKKFPNKTPKQQK